jgi:hypothetical protein
VQRGAHPTVGCRLQRRMDIIRLPHAPPHGKGALFLISLLLSTLSYLYSILNVVDNKSVILTVDINEH